MQGKNPESLTTDLETLSSLAGVRSVRVAMPGGAPVYFIKCPTTGRVLGNGDSLFRHELIQILRARATKKNSKKKGL